MAVKADIVLSVSPAITEIGPLHQWAQPRAGSLSPLQTAGNAPFPTNVPLHVLYRWYAVCEIWTEDTHSDGAEAGAFVETVSISRRAWHVGSMSMLSSFWP